METAAPRSPSVFKRWFSTPAHRAPDNELPSPLPLCPQSPLRKPLPSRQGRTVIKIIALAAAAKEEATHVFFARSSSDPVPRRVWQRATSKGDLCKLSPAIRLRRPSSVPSMVSASLQTTEPSAISTAHPGNRTRSARPRHGCFLDLVESVHPVLASRYRLRTATVEFPATHDESLLCELASTCCSDAFPAAASPLGFPLQTPASSQSVSSAGSPSSIGQTQKAARAARSHSTTAELPRSFPHPTAMKCLRLNLKAVNLARVRERQVQSLSAWAESLHQ